MKLNLKKSKKSTAETKRKKVSELEPLSDTIKEAAKEKRGGKSKAVEAMAKARAAAKSGNKAKKGATKKPKAFTWKAPDTLGPSFPVEVSFLTEKDGMPGGKWRAIRVK